MIDENTFYDEEYYEKDDEKNSSKFVNNRCLDDFHRYFIDIFVIHHVFYTKILQSTDLSLIFITTRCKVAWPLANGV